MPIYTVGLTSNFVRNTFEKSPSIALQADLASAERVPEPVRLAADLFLPGSLSAFATGGVPKAADGVITWFGGDQLLQGPAAIIRCHMRTMGRRCFVPVHFPYLSALDLVSAQPRWMTSGRSQNYWTSGVRILSTFSPSPLVQSTLRDISEPWALLVLALLSEGATPGSGVEALNRLMNDRRIPPVLGALALRNLAVLLIRHNELQKAGQLLEFGTKAYQGYAELSYVAAMLCFRQQVPSKAVALLKQDHPVNRAFLGSGGEDSYRRGWLMGLLAAGVGNQEMAFEHFRLGMVCRPVFAPAIDELLKLRCSAAHIEKHQWEFCRLVRQEPRYLEPVVNYLLLHRAFAGVRRIAETMPLPPGKKAELLDRLESAASPFRSGFSPGVGRPGVTLCGPFLEHSSAARVNREVGASLLESSDLDMSLEPSSHPKLLSKVVTRGDRILNGFLRHPRHLDLTIRNQWPPDFQRPSRGKLAVILSWGYRAVPRAWIAQIESNVDELWVPSHFVRDTFVCRGVSGGRIHVIPPGTDSDLFSTEGPASRPNGCRRFVFFFKGKLTLDGGADLLLRAFREAFNPGDDVTLVMNIWSGKSRQENALGGFVRTYLSDCMAPHVLLLPGQHDDAMLAAFYRGADAFVYPYRASGFPMPVLDAMACGKPVITTAEGPSRDFCSEQTACLIPAQESKVPVEPPPVGELAGEFTWFEADVRELAQTMLRVYQNSEQFLQRGRTAAESIRQSHGWSRITEAYRRRVRHLVAADGCQNQPESA